MEEASLGESGGEAVFTQDGGAQTEPLKVFVTDRGLANVLAEVDLCKLKCKMLHLAKMTDKLIQSLLGGKLTGEGGLNNLW